MNGENLHEQLANAFVKIETLTHDLINSQEHIAYLTSENQRLQHALNRAGEVVEELRVVDVEVARLHELVEFWRPVMQAAVVNLSSRVGLHPEIAGTVAALSVALEEDQQ